MFFFHLDSYELKEKITVRDEKQRRKFSNYEWKLGLLNFRAQWSALEKVFP